MLQNEMPLIPGLSSFSTISGKFPIPFGITSCHSIFLFNAPMGLLGTPSVPEAKKQARGATKSFSFVFGRDANAALNSPKEEARCRKVLTFSQSGRIEEVEAAVGKDDSSFSTPKKENTLSLIFKF